MSKLKEILFSPSKFFSKVKKEMGLGQAFNFLVVYYLFYTVLSGVTFYFLGKESFYGSLAKLSIDIFPGFWIIFIILGYFLGILFSFVGAFFLQIWLKIFKGKGKYSDAYKLKIYSNAPYYLFGWIPLIGWLSIFYVLVLLIIGTVKMYKFSSLRATLIYVIPLVAIFFLVLIFIFIVFMGAMAVGPSEAIF